MKRALIISACLLGLAPAAFAQETEDEARERSFLTRLIEDNLSGDHHSVRIEGFRGALSAQAQFDLLSISDDDGVWITLRDGVLDWNRSALFTRRLEVTAITVAEIDMPRLPNPAEAELPSPHATPFSLPELPVSVDIGEISADRVALGAEVLGQPVVAELSGSAQLADGEGSAELRIERTDGPLGVLSLDGAYTNATDILTIHASLREDAGGILVEQIGLEGRPSIDLSIQGHGPISDFVADIVLATDDQPRVEGEVSLTTLAPDDGQPDAAPTRRFAANLGGDITPLFIPEYRSFFGPDVQFEITGLMEPGGRLEIDRLSLLAEAVELQGALSLAEDGLPDAFDLSLTLGEAGGAPVMLPVSGPRAFVDHAFFQASYAAAQGDEWVLDAALVGFERSDIAIETAILRGTGTIGRRAGDQPGTLLRAVTGELGFNLLGFSHADPALQTALGRNLDGDLSVNWQDDQPIDISALRLVAGDAALTATAQIQGFDRLYETTTAAELQLGNLARFAAISGQSGLRGAADLGLRGTIVPLSGAFDLAVEGTGNNLAIGIAALDPLIAGSATFNGEVARDEAGTTLRDATLQTPAVGITLAGTLADTGSALTLAARLDNVGRIAEGISGPATASGTATSGADGRWTLALDTSGPGGSGARLAGDVITGGAGGLRLDLGVTGTAPLALASNFIPSASVQGPARFDLALRGPADLSALSGQISTTGARAVFPDLRTALTDISAQADISGGQAQITASTGVDGAGRVSVSGPVGLSAPFTAALDITLANVPLVDPALYETTLNGALTLRGPIMGSGGMLAGRIDVGETEIQVPSTSFGAGGGVPAITHQGEPAPVRATRARAGLLGDGGRSAATTGGGPDIGLDVLISAPERVFVRGRGLDAELGGQFRIGGTLSNVIPVGELQLIRGRFDILGTRLTLQEGALTTSGSLMPHIRVLALTQTDDAQIEITVAGPADDISVNFASTPDLPEDEILARLLFGRPISEMSPLQAAQMAMAVSTLTGGGDGVLNRLRRDFGLDDLDVTTGADGGAAVRMGRYISDNVYTDVTIDSSGRSEINLNLDITDDVTAKGSLGSDGQTGLGIFFERDY